MYNKVVLGGTFDVIHKGHIMLLKRAFDLSKLVSIGLTTENFATKVKSYPVINYEKRKQILENLMKQEGWANKYEILPLSDPYGIATSAEDIEAIVVSEETLPPAREINAIRRRKKLYPLDIICVGTVFADDKKPITATRIRNGDIDSDGRLLK